MAPTCELHLEAHSPVAAKPRHACHSMPTAHIWAASGGAFALHPASSSARGDLLAKRRRFSMLPGRATCWCEPEICESSPRPISVVLHAIGRTWLHLHVG